MSPRHYIFGYGSLVSATDPMASRHGAGEEMVYGSLVGYRRRWNTAMDNRAPLNDRAFYVEADTLSRPDIHVVALNLEATTVGSVNGRAFSVPQDLLSAFDRRELHYDRIDVTEAFAPAVTGRVWTYVANEQALLDFARGQQRDAIFISRSYFEGVVAAFRALGDDAYAAFVASTSAPECPLRELQRVQK